MKYIMNFRMPKKQSRKISTPRGIREIMASTTTKKISIVFSIATVVPP
jgi:hypothetical protein